MMSNPDQLGTLSPALSDPPLAPGDYTLEKSFETRRKTGRTKVEAGKTAAIDVKLPE